VARRRRSAVSSVVPPPPTFVSCTWCVRIEVEVMVRFLLVVLWRGVCGMEDGGLAEMQSAPQTCSPALA
jgi:hypothetical protein